METNSRVRVLRIALVLVGLIFIFGVYPLMMSLWPSGWRWQPNQPEYEQMILGVYATLGVFLLLAARNPLANLSLIWFTVWSSLVHAGIMAVQAMNMPSANRKSGFGRYAGLTGIGEQSFVSLRCRPRREFYAIFFWRTSASQRLV